MPNLIRDRHGTQYLSAGCLFILFLGVFWNLWDISLNTQGIGIERLMDVRLWPHFMEVGVHGGQFRALIGLYHDRIRVTCSGILC